MGLIRPVFRDILTCSRAPWKLMKRYKLVAAAVSENDLYHLWPEMPSEGAFFSLLKEPYNTDLFSDALLRCLKSGHWTQWLSDVKSYFLVLHLKISPSNEYRFSGVKYPAAVWFGWAFTQCLWTSQEMTNSWKRQNDTIRDKTYELTLLWSITTWPSSLSV